MGCNLHKGARCSLMKCTRDQREGGEGMRQKKHCDDDDDKMNDNTEETKVQEMVVCN